MEGRERLRELERERTDAVRCDRERLGAAIRDGRADPGDTLVRKADEKIAAQKRRVEAVSGLEQLEQEILKLVARNRERWRAEAEEEIAKARDELEAKLDAYLAARRAVTELEVVTTFLDQFASKPSRSFDPFDRPIVTGIGIVQWQDLGAADGRNDRGGWRACLTSETGTTSCGVPPGASRTTRTPRATRRRLRDHVRPHPPRRRSQESSPAALGRDGEGRSLSAGAVHTPSALTDREANPKRGATDAPLSPHPGD